MDRVYNPDDLPNDLPNDHSALKLLKGDAFQVIVLVSCEIAYTVLHKKLTTVTYGCFFRFFSSSSLFRAHRVVLWMNITRVISSSLLKLLGGMIAC